MKKIALYTLLATQLSACALFMAPFDNNEYGLVNRMRTIVARNSCSTSDVSELYETSLELKNYSQYLPKNEKTVSMTSDLFVVVEELKKKENPGSVYCSAKLNIIGKSAEEIQQVIGKRPR